MYFLQLTNFFNPYIIIFNLFSSQLFDVTLLDPGFVIGLISFPLFKDGDVVISQTVWTWTWASCLIHASPFSFNNGGQRTQLHQLVMLFRWVGLNSRSRKPISCRQKVFNQIEAQRLNFLFLEREFYLMINHILS